MSDEVTTQFKIEKRDTHPLGNLITAPLQAIVESQSFTTESILEYIYKFCEGSPNEIRGKIANNEPLPLKNIQFALQRSEQNDRGQIETNDYMLQVPLITMIPVPHLGVTSAELSLNFKVVDVIKKDEKDEKTGTATKGVFNKNVIQTRYTSSKIGSSESTSDISIKIKISQPETPDGLAKFLTSASSSIIQKYKEVDVQNE